MSVWDWIVGALTGRTPTEAVGRRSRSANGVDRTVTTLRRSDVAASVAEPTAEPEHQHPWWAPEGIVCRELEPVPIPELDAQARAAENLLVSHFDGHDLSLPSLPHIPERVLRKLRQRNHDLNDIAKDVSEDQVMAAELIRMANSPLYGGLSKITAIKPALARLGSSAIRTLMMRQSFRAATFSSRAGDAEFATIVWYRSLANAYIMRTLAGLTEVDAEDAFLIGLLHNIGSVIVLRIVDDHQVESDYEMDIDTFEYLCAECHQEFGELIAVSWALPDDLTALITRHSDYPAADDPLRTERLLLILSEMISRMLGYGPAAAYNLMEAPVVRDLGFERRPVFSEVLKRLPRYLEESLIGFGAVPDIKRRCGDDGKPLLVRWLADIRRGRTDDRKLRGRRRSPRWTSETKHLFIWIDGKPLPDPLRVIDLSQGGACLKLPSPVDVGTLVRIAEERLGESVPGKVVHCPMNPDPLGFYSVGIRFDDSSGP